MKTLVIFVFIIIAQFISLPAFTENENQYLGDTIDFETPLEKSIKDKDINVDEAFLGSDENTLDKEFERKYKKTKGSSVATGDVEDMDTKVSEKEKLIERGQDSSGTHENDSQYLEADLVRKMKKIATSGEHNFAFLFYRDTYQYIDAQKSFIKTFRKEDSSTAGIIRFSAHNFLLHRNYLDLGLGLGVGLGYNSGMGRYSGTNIIAPARIFLWTAPIDLSFLIEAPVTRFFKISAAAGPSLMGLWQHRTDFDEGNKMKDLRQLGPGVFMEGKLNASLSDFIPRKSISMFYEYSVTKMYFSVSARGEYYDSFKSTDVRISGFSLGAGFTFEYL